MTSGKSVEAGTRDKRTGQTLCGVFVGTKNSPRTSDYYLRS